MKILIVEDKIDIASMIEKAIIGMDEGHEVLGILTRAEDVEAFVKDKRPDFVFMDIDLAGKMTGIECAGILNKPPYEIPSLFLTDYADEIINAMGVKPLYFLPKPFKVSHIQVAVIQARQQLRDKLPEVENKVKKLGDYEFNTEHKTLKLKKDIIKLSDKELKLVAILFDNLGNTVDYETIKKHVWEDGLPMDDAFRQMVGRTKRKLSGLNIRSHQNIGYCIEAEV